MKRREIEIERRNKYFWKRFKLTKNIAKNLLKKRGKREMTSLFRLNVTKITLAIQRYIFGGFPC